jgi:hypothetical protein
MKIIKLFLFLIIISTQVYSQKSTEEQTIKNTFINFLHFYQKNETKFNSFKLYKGVGKNNEPPYTIQWNEVNKYFIWLRKNVPFVGEAYIQAEKKSFLYSDSCFKVYGKDEEMPTGFDYDRWAGGQESIEYMLPFLTSSKNIYKVIFQNKTAYLLIGYPLVKDQKEFEREWARVDFTKEKSDWKMASNIYPFYNN